MSHQCSQCGGYSLQPVISGEDEIGKFVAATMDTIADAAVELHLCPACVMAVLAFRVFHVNRLTHGEKYMCALETWIDEARREDAG